MEGRGKEEEEKKITRAVGNCSSGSIRTVSCFWLDIRAGTKAPAPLRWSLGVNPARGQERNSGQNAVQGTE